MPSLAALLALGLLMLAAGIGLRDPSPPDEPRFVLAAQQMIASGDWLFPRRGSELYAHKPAVFMWLQAAAYTVVGNWRVAFLLPSLLAAMATLWLCWDLTARLWGRRFAPYAALALLLCLQFGLQARRAQIDMVLVALTTLSLWALLIHLLKGPNRPALWLGGFAAGLGTVTKGVGFLPLLVLLPWLRVRRDLQQGSVATPTGWRWSLLTVGFLCGVGLWLLPMLHGALGSDDPALHGYVDEILLRQTGERYANAWHHRQPPWYYLQVIATLWLPGALLLPWLLPAWVRRLRRRDPRQWLLLGWSVLVLLFFSLSAGKREVYIFPALPALCIAAAPLLPGLLRKPAVRRTLLGYVLALAAILVAIGVVGLTDAGGMASRLGEQRALTPTELGDAFVWVLLTGLAGLAVAGWGRRRRAGAVVIVFTTLLWGVHGLRLAPILDASSSARTLMQAVGARIGPQAELGMLAWREQHLLQADRPTTDFGFERPWHLQWQDASVWLQQRPAERWLFVLDDALSPCVDATQTVPIGRSSRRDWLLVPGSAWRAGCVTPEFASGDGAERD